MRRCYLLTAIIGVVLPLAASAQRPVFHISRPFLDNLSAQFGGDKMDLGEMDENDDAVLAHMRRVKERKSPLIEGFSTYRGSVRTKSLHLHWDADEEMEEEALDMNVRYYYGRMALGNGNVLRDGDRGSPKGNGRI